MKKSDLMLPYLTAAPINVGSQVVFIDGSYTLAINSNSFEMKHDYVDYLGSSEKIYTVVAVNVTVPKEDCATESLSSYTNNCIVKSEDGDIVFCSKINLLNIKASGAATDYTLKQQSVVYQVMVTNSEEDEALSRWETMHKSDLGK